MGWKTEQASTPKGFIRADEVGKEKQIVGMHRSPFRLPKCCASRTAQNDAIHGKVGAARSSKCLHHYTPLHWRQGQSGNGGHHCTWIPREGFDDCSKSCSCATSSQPKPNSHRMGSVAGWIQASAKVKGCYPMSCRMSYDGDRSNMRSTALVKIDIIVR